MKANRRGWAQSGPEGFVLSRSIQTFIADGTSAVDLPELLVQSVSFVLVNCKNQEEVDRYWNALLEGGKPAAGLNTNTASAKS
jgi:predicted 3-demethylubiquinone-9 3-methyltransferase (glyoxalase superfamily)